MVPELRAELEEAGGGERRGGAERPSALARVADGVRRVLRLPMGPIAPIGHELTQDLRGASQAVGYVRHLARGNRIRRRQFFERASDEQPPVLLLHGFLGTRGSMYLLERRLLDDGRCVISFNLGMFNWRDIRASAFLVHRKIESILAQTPVTKIDIIGHSMGGLIGLYYVKKLGGAARVRKLVMMGTPQHGTWAALLGIATVGLLSSSSWQLLPRSAFLAELARGTLPGGVEYYTISAQRDWVCPVDSTRFEGAVSITVPLGHAGLVMSSEVYEHLREALAAPPAGSSALPGLPVGVVGRR